MKKLLPIQLLGLLLATLLQGCLKDTCTRRFTMYTPVYKSHAEVRANIKSNPAKAVAAAGKMFIKGNFIFLNEPDKGVHIIDNSNPARPVNKYFVDIPGNIDLAVEGNTLYADLYTDLVALDISNPAQVVVKKIVENVFPFRRYSNGFMADTSKIIVDWVARDTVVKCDAFVFNPRFLMMDAAFSSSSLAAPALRGVGGSMARFALMHHYLYTVSDRDLNVFDIAQPDNPVFRNAVDIGWAIETIYPFGNNLFIGSNTGMFIFGTSSPEAPNKLSNFQHARVCDPVIADDKHAFVTLRSGNQCAGFINQLDVLDITNLMQPKLLKTYRLTNPHGLSKWNNLLFICDGRDGLKVFDATDVNNLKLLKTFDGIETYDVIAHNNLAIVSAKDGLYQFDFSNPQNIFLTSKINRTK